MKKVPTLFERDWNGDKSRVIDKVNPACQWVIEGEGVATQKHDGTACLVEDGELFVRFDAKHGKQPPPNFHPAQDEADPETGHWPGWVPAGQAPQYKWQKVAFKNSGPLPNGTYEACGPHFQANPEGFDSDRLIPHGSIVLDAPRTFDALREWFVGKEIEGIVWHHPDGRMAKAKVRDFGLRRDRPAKGGTRDE